MNHDETRESIITANESAQNTTFLMQNRRAFSHVRFRPISQGNHKVKIESKHESVAGSRNSGLLNFLNKVGATTTKPTVVVTPMNVSINH